MIVSKKYCCLFSDSFITFNFITFNCACLKLCFTEAATEWQDILQKKGTGPSTWKKGHKRDENVKKNRRITLYRLVCGTFFTFSDNCKKFICKKESKKLSPCTRPTLKLNKLTLLLEPRSQPLFFK